MAKRLIFVATILIFSITTFSQSSPKSNFTGIEVSSFNQNDIFLKWNLNQLNLEKTLIDNNEFSVINFEGCNFTDIISSPELPYQEFKIGIPNNSSLRHILSNVKYETITNVTPIPVGKPFKEKSGIISLTRNKNSENYNFSPKEIIEFSEQSYFKDMPVVQVKFFPVTYDANNKTIRYIKSANIRIIITDADRQNTRSAKNKYLKDIYNNYVINYPQALNWLVTKSKSLTKPAFVPQGPWYKITITEDGLYKIASTTLAAAGINISAIDPRTIQIYNNGGMPLNINAMATENNPTEPVENAIYVSGESDGSFDAGDYVLFYGTELGGWNYSSAHSDFAFVQHPYDTKNYYWLT
jgi:hypothetical protein